MAPGATGDESDAGTPGQFAIGLGHQRGPAFVSRHDGVHAGIEKPIKRGQIAFSRYTKYPLNSLCLEGFDEHCPTMT